MSEPFDLAHFHHLLRTQMFGHNLIFEPSVGSTMDLARDAAKHGAPEGTVVLADEQTAGRGRLGRSWITPPAVNLASTIILRPPATALRAVSMVTPLAICEAVEEVAGVRCAIKWPNDVQAGGKKLAGVLIETEVTDGESVVLVGAGINVNFDPRQHEEIRDIATSVAAELGKAIERERLFAEYLARFEERYNAAKDGASMRDDWRARLSMLGQNVKVTWPGRSVEGRAEDVDDDGSLIVRTASGEAVAVEAGDVTLRG
jgi:BirA family biotin operon repressor/biotin-[acetyl-CoA-carboxylase] ligase